MKAQLLRDVIPSPQMEEWKGSTQQMVEAVEINKRWQSPALLAVFQAGRQASWKSERIEEEENKMIFRF